LVNITHYSCIPQPPLGVNLKSENINGEMIGIRETLHQYIPTKSVGSSRGFVEKYVSVWLGPADLCKSSKCKTSSAWSSNCYWEVGWFGSGCWRLANKDVPVQGK